MYTEQSTNGMLGNKAKVTRWKNPCVDGEALPKLKFLMSWQCGAGIVTGGNGPFSDRVLSPQLPAATGGQGSLHFKIISATTAILTVSCLSDFKTTAGWASHGQRALLKTYSTIPMAAHCLRARQQQH